MKTILTLSLAVLLTGCAHLAPQAPTAAELAQLQAKPVLIVGMKPIAMQLKAKNGEVYDAVRFQDPNTSKWYDPDGQPVNEEMFRVLSDGTVCEPNKVSFNGRPHLLYLGENRGDIVVKACALQADVDAHQRFGYAIGVVGLLASPVIAGGGLLAGGTVDTVDALSKDAPTTNEEILAVNMRYVESLNVVASSGDNSNSAK